MLNITFLGTIVILVVLGVVILAAMRGGAVSPVVTFGGPFDLKSRNTAVSSSDFGTPAQASAYLRNGSGTFQTFLYLDTIAKTGEYSPCGSSPAEPACDTGLYRTCGCESKTACNQCVHKGYKTIFSLYGVYTLEALNVPDAGRQNAVAAQLTVLTTSSGSLFKETVALPALPLQKWVMVTVVHEGRRVDVYYNDKLLSSATLENHISTDNFNMTYVDVGDAGLTGVATLLRFYDGAANGYDVKSQYVNQVDTRGAPVETNAQKAEYSTAISKSNAGSLLSRLCLDGSCLSGGMFRPPTVTFQAGADEPAQMGSISSLYALDTPYA